VIGPAHGSRCGLAQHRLGCAGVALALEQHAKHVTFVRSPITSLLFDNARLVNHPGPGEVMFAFKDLTRPSTSEHQSEAIEIAHESRWLVVQVPTHPR